MSKIIFNLITIFVIAPLLFIEQGWAISTLWSWFVVPLGAPEIGIATAIGITLLIGVVRMKGSRNNDRTQRERLEFLIAVALTPLIGVGIGWIVLQFA